MKKIIRRFLISAAIIVFTAGNVLALNLPALDYSGMYTYDSSTGILSSGSIVNLVIYKDLSFTFSDTTYENIIDANVNINTGTFVGYDFSGNAQFNDGTFSIIDGSGTYFSADLTNIAVVPTGPLGSGVINSMFYANLDNVSLFTPSLSQFINEMVPSVTGSGLASSRISLDLFLGQVDFNLGDSWGNVSGKVTSVPNASIMWLLGTAFIVLGFIGRRKSHEQL